MPKKRKKAKPEGAVYYKRTFLNDPGWHSSAHIIAQIDENDTYPTLEIADCSRKITLALDGENQECRDHSMRKLELVCKTLNAFKKKLKQEWARNPIVPVDETSTE